MWYLLAVIGLLITGTQADDHGSNTISFSSETFAESITTNPHFVMFYAPWCGHCKRLSPTWDDLGKKYNQAENQEVVIGKVDCTQHTSLCSSQDVTGYPTLKIFNKSPEGGVKYRGPRDLASLEKFISEQLGTEVQEDTLDVPAAVTGLVEHTDASFKSSVVKGNHFIKFYAPWCGHCQRMAPTWDLLAKSLEHDKSVVIGKLDCTKYRDVCTEYEVKGYPTLLWIEDGVKKEKYSGDRSLDDMKNFVVSHLGDEAAVPKDAEEPQPPVLILTAENFENAVSSGFTFVKYYAPWCGHCKRMAPTYDELGRKFIGHENVKIAKVDCTQDVNRQLCSEQKVNGFPTIFLYKDGEKGAEYNGDRSLDNMVTFISAFIQHEEL